MVDIHEHGAGAPHAVLFKTGMGGDVLELEVAFVEIKLVLSHIGGEEDVGETIVVEIANGYAAAVVEVPEEEAVVQFLIHHFIVKVDTGVVHELKERRVSLRATEQPIDTGTAAGKAFLDMLGVFAEFEANLRKERQAEGIAAAKARGVYKGRKSKIDATAVHNLRYRDKFGPAEIARRLGIGRASVYRVLGKKAA